MKGTSSTSGDALRLRSAIINSPETADFMAGVPLEAAHQRERWGADHDAGKSPFDWFWLIGYLAQKAADAAVRGDDEKARHHTISTAAALANWHAALSGADTRMRPGIDTPTVGGELMLSCPKCHKGKLVDRQDTDPPNARFMKMVCATCDDGDFHAPEYRDAGLHWINPVEHLR